jgi:hypothetical protein
MSDAFSASVGLSVSTAVNAGSTTFMPTFFRIVYLAQDLIFWTGTQRGDL